MRESVRRGRRAAVRRVVAGGGGIGGVVVAATQGFPPTMLGAVGAVALLTVVWPSSAGRWAAGAAGERATARALEGVERGGYAVLHDVGLAGRRWNIDHVLLGPAGVVIVESKQWRDPVRITRRRPALVDERVGWQVDAVATALRDPNVAVHGFLCVHGAAVRRRWWTGARWAPVGDGRHLRRWLQRLPDSPTDGQMGRRVFEGRS